MGLVVNHQATPTTVSCAAHRHTHTPLTVSDLCCEAQLKRVLRQVTTSLQETKRRSVFWRLYQMLGSFPRKPSQSRTCRKVWDLGGFSRGGML